MSRVIFFWPFLHFFEPDRTVTLDPFLLVQTVIVAAPALAVKLALTATQTTAAMAMNPLLGLRLKRTRYVSFRGVGTRFLTYRATHAVLPHAL
jgi:hypothetical protein